MNWRMKLLVGVLAGFVLILQYRLWVGQGSLAEVNNLRKKVSQQRQELEKLGQRNQGLRAEVEDLKHGLKAVEARARSELGMIKEGETFYQVVSPRAETKK
jgi:cell division protein FtsB